MRKVHSVYNGTETLSHLVPKIWSLVPYEIRQYAKLGDFKSKIKNGLHLIAPADYTKIFTSNRIHLEKPRFTILATVSTIVAHISNI